MSFLTDYPYSVYIHIPFCKTRCTYCSFNTYVGLERLIPQYVAAICEEIAWVAQRFGKLPVHTVYLGGGTPSILPATSIGVILAAVADNLPLVQDAEITMEANPRTLTADYCSQINAIGVNRLSIGAQSAQEADLQLFNRQHHWRDVDAAIEQARIAGLSNTSVDLIYGAPGQDAHGWLDTLEKAIQLGTEHISLYAMGIEQNTPLHKWVTSGRVLAVDSDLTADMYDAASNMLNEAGFEQYEISNWAIRGHECRHNLQYWRNLPYIGIGAGAHGYISSIRYANVVDPREYITRVNSANPGTQSSPAEDTMVSEVLTEAEIRTETMILGLRLTEEGVLKDVFEKRFGQSIESVYGPILDRLQQRNLIDILSDRIRLSEDVRLTANQALVEFV